MPYQTLNQFPPLHPGEILKEEFLEPLGLTAYALAKACFIPRSRIERIIRGQLGISVDTALRLSRLFGMSDQFFINLQSHYEMRKANFELSESLSRINPLQKAA
jgi:antitoxin HigA-1